MRTKQLLHGLQLLVDDEDWEIARQPGWYAWKHGRVWYVRRNRREGSRHRVEVLHRQILLPPSSVFIDHINGDGLDNRRANLRLVTHQQNHCNRVHKIVGASSQYRGVDRYRGRWRARIKHNQKPQHLGLFDSEEEAARAYDTAGRLRDPLHFTPNFPGVL